MNDVRLFPSLLAWSAVPWTESETELKVLWAVSEADLAMFLVTESVRGVEALLPGLTMQRPFWLIGVSEVVLS